MPDLKTFDEVQPRRFPFDLGGSQIEHPFEQSRRFPGPSTAASSTKIRSFAFYQFLNESQLFPGLSRAAGQARLPSDPEKTKPNTLEELTREDQSPAKGPKTPKRRSQRT